MAENNAFAGLPLSMPRRDVLSALGGLTVAAATVGSVAEAKASSVQHPEQLKNLDPIKTELVMNLVVTCSSPMAMGPSKEAKDGIRDEVWPIIGGRFWGPRLRGKVIAGGADFPVTRPDGVSVVDAFYRIQEDDGTIIIIHNKGLTYPPVGAGHEHYRLAPVFTTVKGPHDWLNKSIFVATLLYGNEMPTEMQLAKGPDQNDRLIQVHRIF